MSKIFISHSSKDNTIARALTKWLDENGWAGQYFLDFDRDAIAPGERWEMTLRAAARRCEVVLLLLSRSWIESTWCQDEMRLARHLGKQLIGVVIDPGLKLSKIPSLITREWQICYLNPERDRQEIRISRARSVTLSASGLYRLRIGLERAGLSPEAFAWPPSGDPDRVPYRGLRPLDEQDAAVFFGRDAEILDALGQLSAMRDGLTELCMTIVGASGAGKSSFMRAGLMPRLRRDTAQFVVARPLRPARGIIDGPDGLLASLEALYKDFGISTSRARLRERLNKDGLAAALDEVRCCAVIDPDNPAPPPTIILPLDQAEELFAEDYADEAEQFFGMIRDMDATEPDLEQSTKSPVILLITIRSDSYNAMQSGAALGTMPRRLFDLSPVSPFSYEQIVTGPARRVEECGNQLKIDPQLTKKLLEGAKGYDALPLLAFTLERLYIEYTGEGELTLEQYKAMGAEKGVIEAAVAAALAEPEAPPAIPDTWREQEEGLRKAFIPLMVDISEVNEPIRRPASWDKLPGESVALIERLVTQRLLVRDRQQIGGKKLDSVEIAHDSLLRNWPALSDWVDSESARIWLVGEARRGARRWHNAGQIDDDLTLRGARLQATLALLGDEVYGPRLESEKSVEFVRACEALEIKIEAERRRLVRWRNGAAVIAILVLTVSSWGLAQLWSLADESLKSSGKAWVQRARQDLGADRPYAAYRQAGMVLGLGPDKTGRPFLDDDSAEAREARTIYDFTSALMVEPHIVYDHGKPVFSLAVSPDGRHLATGSVGDIHIRHLEKHTVDFTLSGHANQVHRLRFAGSPDRLVTSDIDGRIGFWDLSEGTGRIECPQSGAYLYGLDYAQGIAVAAFGGEGAIELWDPETRTLIYRHDGDGRPLVTAALDATGSMLVTGSQSGVVTLWVVDPEAAEPLRQHARNPSDDTAKPVHTGIIFSLAFSPDGREILSTATDNMVVRWSADDLTMLRTLPRHTTEMWDASYHVKGSVIVTSARDNVLRLFDTQSGSQIGAIDRHDGWIYETLSHSGELISASDDGTVKRFDLETALQGVTALASNDDDVLRGAFSADGRSLVTGGWNHKTHSANVWNVQSERIVKHCSVTFEAQFNDLDIDSGSATLAVATTGQGGIQTWALETCKPLARFQRPDHADPIEVLTFAPKRDLLASAPTDSKDGIRVVLFDTGTGAVLAEVAEHEKTVTAIAFDPVFQRLATGDSNGRLILWKVTAGADPALVIERVHEGGKYIKALAFSPDGALLASGADQGALMLFDLANPTAPPQALTKHSGMVNNVAFSGDGTLLTAGADDQVISFWKLSDGSAIQDGLLAAMTGIWGPFAHHPQKPWLAFDGGNGVARIWKLPTGARRKAARASLAQRFGIETYEERTITAEQAPLCGSK